MNSVPLPAHPLKLRALISRAHLLWALPFLLSCAAGSSLDRSNLPQARPREGMRVIRSVRYYDVSALTPSAEHQQVDSLRAHNGAPAAPAVGLTSTSWRLGTGPSGTQTSCAAAPLIVEMHIEMFIPRHTNVARADSVMTWTPYVQALTRHEARHDSIAVAVTNAFLNEVRNSTAASRTTAFSMQECLTTLTNRLHRAQKTYDSVSAHGIREGIALRARR